MRLARHLRITVPSLIVCMLLSGNASAMIHPTALAFTIVAALIALKLPQHRQGIETSYLIGLPLYCGFRAVTGSSLQGVGEYLALGLCGSVYGLIWFGLSPESRAPTWRRRTTAVPVMALAGVLIQGQDSTHPGLGMLWIAYSLLATAVVVSVAVWQRSNPTEIWSFAAAVTLSLGVRTFQYPEPPNAFDIALVFLPYAAGLLTTLASFPVELRSRRRVAAMRSLRLS